MKPDYPPCIQCGYCCTVRPCIFGKWNADQSKCAYLTAENKCGKYEEIKKLEAHCKYPMFGWGCSSTLFNEVREAKIKADKEQT